MTEKTRWEIDLIDGVSAPARKSENALERLQRRFQRLSMSEGLAASRLGMQLGLASAAYRKHADIISGRMSGPVRAGSFDAVARSIAINGEAAWGRVKVASGKAASFVKKHWASAAQVVTTKLKDVTLGAGMATLGLAAGVTYLAGKYANLGQKSRSAFTMMLGSETAGKAAFNESIALAGEMGMRIAEVTGSYQRFLSMGFGGGEAVEIIKMGADMTALGASAEKVSSVLDAMGKIKATGTLQGDELMMLAEAGINIGAIYDRLGAKFGKTRGEVVKMKEAGKISAEDAIKAIKDTVLATTGQTEFGAARKKIMGSTLAGSFSQLTSKIENSLVTLGDKAAPALTRVVNALSNMASEFLDSKAGSDFISGIVKDIERMSDFLVDSTPLIKEFTGAFGSSFLEVLREVPRSFGSMNAEANNPAAVKNIKEMGKSIGELTAALALAAAGFVYLTAKAAELYSYLKWISPIFLASKAAGALGGMAAFASEDARLNQEARARAYGVAAGGTTEAGIRGFIPQTIGGAPASMGLNAKPGLVSNTTTNTIPVTVNVTAPEGGTAADGKTWGAGAGRGIERGIMSGLGGANMANGT